MFDHAKSSFYIFYTIQLAINNQRIVVLSLTDEWLYLTTKVFYVTKKIINVTHSMSMFIICVKIFTVNFDDHKILQYYTSFYITDSFGRRCTTNYTQINVSQSVCERARQLSMSPTIRYHCRIPLDVPLAHTSSALCNLWNTLHRLCRLSCAFMSAVWWPVCCLMTCLLTCIRSINVIIIIIMN